MLAVVLCMATLPSHLAPSAPAKPKWVLTFHDEFDGRSGAAPAPARWRHDVGGSGFGNNELESYTDGAANSFLDGRGHLVIEARKEHTVGPDRIPRDYSSARILTRGLFAQKYGRFEARIKLPRGQGIWPAFWLLGDDIGAAGWPRCGEVDILESIGPKADIAYGTLHGPGYSGAGGRQGRYHAPKSLAEGYHLYAVEWDPAGIRWFVDGHPYHTVTPADVKPNAWPFDQPFFIILNLAVGGGWPGNPDASTAFPQRMLVDYVRVYRDASR